MPFSRMENTTFAMPNIIDSHDMGLKTVLQSRCPKRNVYSTPIRKTFLLLASCRNGSIYPTTKQGMVIGFQSKGESISETANFVKSWAIDDRGERRLRRFVRANRRATVEQLTTQMNQGATNSVFQTTVQRKLQHICLRSRRLVHATMLTAVHRQRTLEFAHRYHNWTSSEW
ncbi:transposable element Tcb1 transposase [Trichonephila clavipes]|nr:transposable element Tcb1 transposase [Trichonephila clavipes]